MREPGPALNPRDDILEPGAREDRHPVPGGLPVRGHLVAARGEFVVQQLREGVVRKLGLLQAHHVWLPLIEPRQQTRHALLDGVDVPGRYSHRYEGTGAAINSPAGCSSSPKTRIP